jgi:hypothetical protein
MSEEDQVGVIIGVDPHKRSATIEVVDERGVEAVLHADDAFAIRCSQAAEDASTARCVTSHLLPPR